MSCPIEFQGPVSWGLGLYPLRSTNALGALNMVELGNVSSSLSAGSLHLLETCWDQSHAAEDRKMQHTDWIENQRTEVLPQGLGVSLPVWVCKRLRQNNHEDNQRGLRKKPPTGGASSLRACFHDGKDSTLFLRALRFNWSLMKGPCKEKLHNSQDPILPILQASEDGLSKASYEDWVKSRLLLWTVPQRSN